MHATIAVIGSVNIDLTMQVNHIPAAGETIGDGVFSQLLGGKGANQALAAARAGGQVALVGRVGSDDFAQQAVSFLAGQNINTEALMRARDVATGTALIFVDRQGENSIGVAPGANYALDRKAIDQHAPLIQSAAYVLMQLEIPLDTVRYVLQGSIKSTVVLNAAPMNKLLPSDLALIDILVVNQTETAQLTGVALDHASDNESGDLAKACQSLRQSGVGAVVVTLGAKGAYVQTQEDEHWLPGHVVSVVDTTGAGDTFCGALVARLAELAPDSKYTSLQLLDSVQFAQKAAALAVTQLGAQTAIPTRAAIDAF